ncbi:MAG TPA: bifunctional sugar-1-phosphate nucleotidylyltransferase/acetyltransferase [Methanomassiliicoccales archaeon]|nr:bifunctional sugar-1-phosphate nucleotidylyltransferase/acetyltransferase [Methanomassiliicoccales archaeon]
MKALVLAAGEGTRLRPLTTNIPKPLLTLAGRPYLDHLMGALLEAGIEDVSLLVGWKSNRIKEHYGDGSKVGLNISYLEQKERMGTAHAIGMAASAMDEDFVCINGDVLLSKDDVEGVVKAHRHGSGIVMGAAQVKNPSRFGVIEEDQGRMLRIIEKPKEPPTDLINAGIFVLGTDIFPFIQNTGRSPRGEYEFTDTLNMYARKNDVHLYKLRSYWMDVGLPWDLLKANEILMAELARDIRGEVEDGAVLKGNVVVEKGAVVRSGSYIEGPAYISKGCDIGPNCYIRPSTSLCEGVKVGASVEVKNSIVMARTHIPHHNYVGDSIIGERCNLGAGTKVANLRFDNKNVKVTMKGELVDTGLRKLGVIMGDDVKTGINSMIEPGTIIFERSVIGVGAHAKGTVGPDSWVL